MLFSLLFENPLAFFAVAAALIVCISVHEFSHAKVADLLGDTTPRLLGRVTLNPLAHLDPLGSLLIVFAGFGWGKPVPVNYINLKSPRRDFALISLAGPISNFLLAGLLAFVLNVFEISGISYAIIDLIARINISLGIFNLIPIHPLDGFKAVAGFLPMQLYVQWMEFEKYGIFVLMFLFITDSFQIITTPLIAFFINLFRL